MTEWFESTGIRGVFPLMWGGFAWNKFMFVSFLIEGKKIWKSISIICYCFKSNANHLVFKSFLKPLFFTSRIEYQTKIIRSFVQKFSTSNNFSTIHYNQSTITSNSLIFWFRDSVPIFWECGLEGDGEDTATGLKPDANEVVAAKFWCSCCWSCKKDGDAVGVESLRVCRRVFI